MLKMTYQRTFNIKDTVVNGQQYYYIYILYFNILGV